MEMFAEMDVDVNLLNESETERCQIKYILNDIYFTNHSFGIFTGN